VPPEETGESKPAQQGRPAPVPTGVLVLGLAACVAMLAGIALVTGFFSAPGVPPTGSTASTGTASASAPVLSRAAIPHTPVGTVHVVVRTDAWSLAFDGTAGWLTDADTATVRRFDPSSGRITGTVTGVGQRPVAVTAGGDRIWVADSVDNLVITLDPRDGRTVGAPDTVANQPVGLVDGPGGIWVGSVLGGTVSVLDSRTGAVRASSALPDGVSSLAVGYGAVWVTGQQSSLTRVDPTPVGLVLRWRSVSVGLGPAGVAVGAGSVWVADAQSASVTRVDPATLRVTGSWRLPDGHGGFIQPAAIAVFGGRVWVADAVHDTVAAMDPASGAELGTAVALPGPIRALTAGDGALWAATSYPGAVVRIDPR